MRLHTNLSYVTSCTLLQIGLMLFLGACSPQLVLPPIPETAAPRLYQDVFTSYDDTTLPVKSWLPSGQLRGVIIGLHGFNDYSNFIRDSVPFFSANNLAVYAYDQRGFGQSPSRGRWSGAQALAKDLATFIKLVQNKHPGIPLYILGDSMGGAVTIVTMARNKPPGVDGIILVAPAVWARSEMPYYQRSLLWIAAHTIPWKIVTGSSVKITASDNSEMLKALGRDPLVIKETRIEVLYGLSNLMDEAFFSAELLSQKTLILYGWRDELIPRSPLFSFYQRLPLRSVGQQMMILYEDGYHMLLRDLQAEVVRQDIVDWIDGSELSLESGRGLEAGLTLQID